MKKMILLLGVFLLLILCSGCRHTKQPIYVGPLVSGNISGLPDGVFVTIDFQSRSTKQSVVQTQHTNGTWQDLVPPDTIGYLVTAYATGYSCTPANHTIKLIDYKAYIDAPGILLFQQEATNLDFTCK